MLYNGCRGLVLQDKKSSGGLFQNSVNMLNTTELYTCLKMVKMANNVKIHKERNPSNSPGLYVCIPLTHYRYFNKNKYS